MTTQEYTTSDNSEPWGKFDIAKFMEAVEQAKARDHELLRSMSKSVEEMTCCVCGRKPTIRSGRYGPTWVVCQHYYDAVLSKCVKVDNLPSGTLGGMGIELFDDGPRRF